MKQTEDTLAMEIPLPGEIEYGGIARSLLGLPPAAPKVPDLPAWRVVLNSAITADPAGKKGVAERLGVSRPYVSRVTTGDLQHRVPARFIARVTAVLMQVDCPYLQRPLAPAECGRYAERSYAQVSSFEVDHWRACRACPNNARRNASLAAAQREQDRKATGAGASAARTARTTSPAGSAGTTSSTPATAATGATA